MEAEKTTDYQITVCTVNWFSAEFIEALFLNLSKKAQRKEKIQYIVRRRGKNEGRPIEGKTIKEFCGIRIQGHLKKTIIEKYITVQKWIDRKVEDEFERK
jgi:hypothetical protein